MKIVWIVVSILVLLNLLWFWAAGRGLGHLRHCAWRWAFVGFNLLMLGNLAWLLGGRMVTGLPEQPTTLLTALMIWFMFVLPVALVLLGVSALGRAVFWLGQQIFGRLLAQPADEPTAVMHDPARRKFLAAMAIALPPVVTVGATTSALTQLNQFRVRRIDVPMVGLPDGLDGLTIAHVSDTHVGQFTRGRVLDKFVQATNQINGGKPADLVLMTGDLINNSNRDLPPAIDMMQRMKANHGVYLCEGNHDLIDDGEGFVQQVIQSQLPLLRNEIADVQINRHHVQLLGLVWGPPGRPPGLRVRSTEQQIAEAVEDLHARRDPDAFGILLAHHPHAFDPAAQLGIPLTLAGHTHGGQLHLTDHLGFGPYMYRYWSGLYRRRQAACVVSNGAGNWFPLRLNAPAEIILVTLRAAPAVRV